LRVAITDADPRTAQELAAAVERVLPTADVVVYDDLPAALDGIAQSRPDVVFVAPAVGDVTGPDVAIRLRELDGVDVTLVGLVDAPDADWSTRWVQAGAGVVVSRPVDDLGIRTALRQRAGGIPGPT
jgi:DNA-binding response OmpR family regulator